MHLQDLFFRSGLGHELLWTVYLDFFSYCQQSNWKEVFFANEAVQWFIMEGLRQPLSYAKVMLLYSILTQTAMGWVGFGLGRATVKTFPTHNDRSLHPTDFDDWIFFNMENIYVHPSFTIGWRIMCKRRKVIYNHMHKMNINMQKGKVPHPIVRDGCTWMFHFKYYNIFDMGGGASYHQRRKKKRKEEESFFIRRPLYFHIILKRLLYFAFLLKSSLASIVQE